MAQERLILDPAEITTGRTEFDITPWVDVGGIDWGSAEIEAYRAQAQVGEAVIDYRLPNRQIAAPLVIREQGGTTFAKARSYFQAKAALWQREGGIGKRVLATGGTVYFDVVANGLSLSGDWLQANKDIDTEAELRLEAIPDFYEPEELAAEAEEKTAAELIKVIPDPGGDMPARVRIVVEEKQGADQKGLIWAFRSRHYSSASTAKSAYEAEELEILGSSSKGAFSGASNGTVVSNTALPPIFTPVLGIKPNGTAFPTNTGTNRVFARLRSVDGTAVSARLVWDVGDLVNPTENNAWTFPGGSAFYIADLGEVRLDPAPIGTHRWQGRVDARGTEGGEDIQIDKIWIVNCDEGMGILTAPPQPTVGELKAWDNFNTHSAGTITGKVASLGGTWTGAGDAVGFTIDATNHWITRAEKSDASEAAGYFARAGTATAAAIDLSLDMRPPYNAGFPTSPLIGGFARYLNTSNWLLAAYWYGATADEASPYLVKCVGGTIGFLANSSPVRITGSEWRTLRMVADTAGIVSLYEGPQGAVSKVLSYQDAAFATGGTLASGGFGVYDAYTGGASMTRAYDNFSVTIPSTTADSVVFASQKAQITTQGMYRLGTGGSAYGPISRVVGSLPRLPAGGLENRATELYLKASRADVAELPDSAIDDIAVKVYANRSWLTVPGTI